MNQRSVIAAEHANQAAGLAERSLDRYGPLHPRTLRLCRAFHEIVSGYEAAHLVERQDGTGIVRPL